MPSTKPTTRRQLHLAVLNDSRPVVRMLRNWFVKNGHHCSSAIVADMPQAHTEVEKFLNDKNPDVVIYDVAIPYASSWDLLDVIRKLPSVKSLPFVVTTPNKKELDEAVGRKTNTLEIAGQDTDLQRLLKAVEKAAGSSRP
jgi:CheY-like chemotaxis protein